MTPGAIRRDAAARGSSALKTRPDLALKRVYQPPARGDGLRILVDRLWPRGVSRDAAKIDHWAKEVTPSPALRRWFGHDPRRWTEFQRRYRAELADARDAVDALRAHIGKRRATLLFGAADLERNHAIVLRDALKDDLVTRASSPGRRARPRVDVGTTRRRARG